MPRMPYGWWTETDPPPRIDTEHVGKCDCDGCLGRSVALEVFWWGIGALKYQPVDALFDSAPLEG